MEPQSTFAEPNHLPKSDRIRQWPSTRIYCGAAVMLTPDSGRRLQRRSRDSHEEEQQSTGKTRAGHSLFPNILSERSPTTGAVAVGWDREPTPPSIMAPLSAPHAFKRTSASTVPNFVALSLDRRLDICYPTTQELGWSYSAEDRDLDSEIVACVKEQINVQGALDALHMLQRPRSRRSSGETTPDSLTPTSETRSQAATLRAAARSPTPHGASLAEWEVQRRHQHAERLLSASCRASNRAARKMLAMAANEQLRTSALPERAPMHPLPPMAAPPADASLVVPAAVPDAAHDQSKRHARTRLDGEQSECLQHHMRTPFACLLLALHDALGCRGALS
jgi:hypothetical protein